MSKGVLTFNIEYVEVAGSEVSPVIHMKSQIQSVTTNSGL